MPMTMHLIYILYVVLYLILILLPDYIFMLQNYSL